METEIESGSFDVNGNDVVRNMGIEWEIAILA